MGKRSIVLLAGLLALPAMLAAVPAQAVAAPTIALYPDGSSIPPTLPGVHGATAGEYLWAFGRAPAGTTAVEVQRLRPSGTWVETGATTPAVPNWYSQVRAPQPLGHYGFRVVTKGSYGTAVSAVWKLDVVVQHNTFSFTSTTTTRFVEGLGSVTPPRPTRTLHVQAMESGLWHNVATVRQDTQGRYRFRVLPRGPGARVYRTVVDGGGVGSPPGTIGVSPPWPLFGTVDLTGVDSVHGRVPVRGGDTLVLGADLNAPTTMLWALPGGRRTFQATLRPVAADPGAKIQLVASADSRILLVRDLPAGQDLPVWLDVTGASRLSIGVARDPYSEWDPPRTLLIRPRLTSPAVSLPRTPPLEYLANLTPVTRTACVLVESLEVGTGRPGSLHWGKPGQPCPDGAAVEYDLGGDFTRLRAGTGLPEYGGVGVATLDGGTVTVLGDDRMLGTFSATPEAAPSIDLDVTGVQRLRFVFARNPGAGDGELGVLTPTVLR